MIIAWQRAKEQVKDFQTLRWRSNPGRKRRSDALTIVLQEQKAIVLVLDLTL